MIPELVIMENKMETTRMENQMDKKMDEMETGIIQGLLQSKRAEEGGLICYGWDDTLIVVLTRTAAE